MGIPKGNALEALCGFYETAAAGKSYPAFERETEEYASLLTKMNSLLKQVIEKGGETQSAAELRVKELMESKDNTIIQLQKDVERADEVAHRCELLETENNKLRKDLQTATTTIKALEAIGPRDPDLEKENARLKGKVEALEHTLDTAFSTYGKLDQATTQEPQTSPETLR